MSAFVNPSILIRFAMLSGVLLFGGVTWFLRRSGEGGNEATAETVRTMLWTGRIVWGIALAGSMIVFALIQRDPSPARTRTLSIIAWALCESVALFGGIVWYLTGQNSWYVSGLIFLVLSFLAFPGGRATRPR